ncbi:hypothetical protein [Gordonia humi]|uniref:Transmembrane protein n=1 Tax=Gordonia humi TaxID=686429 RepID=A0A840EW83_9ACTN|nr:hypothetical protein [Gordonia humi]MBB4134574.1 hypothetical protein [Gordonia humi]
MADESEPESKPITVSELIARSEDDTAFPRSASMSVRRSGGDAHSASGATASGMPDYAAPKAPPEPPRVIGASGMPGYTPPAGPEANVVTGIIPVVSDDPDADTGSLRAVDADDLIAYDLPPTEYRTVAAEETTTVVRSATAPEPSPFTDTASIPVVDEAAPAAEPDDADAETSTAALAGTAAFAGVGGAAAVATADDADEDEPELTGRAARKAARAERKAAKRAEKQQAEAADEQAESSADVVEDRAESAEQADVFAADTEDADHSETESEPSAALGWLAFVGELVLGLAVGAGLFWGFTELWKRYVYLALILAIVVIFAIVTFAHLLRKRDLATTLLALAVGMLVTIGPLVLLAAQP